MVKLFKYKISTLEIIVFFVFVFYLIFNIQTPICLQGIIDSPQGIIFLMILVLLLFLYVNPILSILGLFVAYEMIRRTSMVTSSKVSTIQYTPTQIQKERRKVKINLPNAYEMPMVQKESFDNVIPHIEPNSQDLSKKTLEEEVIQTMAPIGVSEQIGYVDTSFKPVLESSHNASSV